MDCCGGDGFVYKSGSHGILLHMMPETNPLTCYLRYFFKIQRLTEPDSPFY